MSTLEVALLGYGLAGSVFHAPLIAATPGMRVAAVVTSDAQRAAQAHAEHPGVVVLPDADALFADARSYDLAVVATPNRTHAPLAMRAIEANLPVVVDKPFAVTAAQAAELIDAAERAKVALTVFQNRRWDGDFLTVRELIDTGKLGEVRRFESRFERWRPVSKGGWREVGTDADGAGLLFDLGSHLVDQALNLFGPVDSVYCELDRRRPDITTDDDVFLALTHASGVRSHLWASAVTPLLGPRFRVLGSAAGYVTYGLDPQEASLRDGDRPGNGKSWGATPSDRWGELGAETDSEPYATVPGDYPAFYTAVSDALRYGAPMPVDPRSALEVMRVLERARHSAESGETVH